jgi:hypothetical protein
MVNKIIKKIYFFCKSLVSGSFWYVRDLAVYIKLARRTPEAGKFYFYPRLLDRSPETHTFDRHYVYMDRWAFKHLLNDHPIKHVDVGSSIRFLSFASTVVPVDFVDIRPIQVDFDNFKCISGSILAMPYADNSVSSLSCLHVAEHIGLGRYGDPLDPEGTKKACLELSRILQPGGHLYFALPIGQGATFFNAHRVHSPAVILSYFQGLKLLSFAAVSDAGNFISQANIDDFKLSSYSCGCFVFTK